MQEIRGLAEVERRVGPSLIWRRSHALDLSKVGHVLECCFREDLSGDEPTATLELLIESCAPDPIQRLRLTLRGVTSLELDGWSVHTSIAGLELIDLSDRQWEHIRWQLRDYETGLIGCYAVEAEIRLEDPGAEKVS